MVWDPGTATGLGPVPGADPLEAARIVLSELPLPNLADLPARAAGPGWVVGVDEPLLPAVLAGELATASGWGKLRSYERAVVEDGLRQVLAAAGDDAGVWLGSARLDGELLRGAGAGFIGLDGAVLDTVDEDEIGEAIDAGLGLLVACVPLDAAQNDPRPVMAPVTSLWKRLGFRVEQLPRTVAVTAV